MFRRNKVLLSVKTLLSSDLETLVKSEQKQAAIFFVSVVNTHC